MALSATGVLGLWSLVVKAVALLVGVLLTNNSFSGSQSSIGYSFVATRWFKLVSIIEAAAAIVPASLAGNDMGILLVSLVDSMLSLSSLPKSYISRSVGKSFRVFCVSRAVIAVLSVATLLSGAQELSFSSTGGGLLPVVMVCSLAARFVISVVLLFMSAISTGQVPLDSNSLATDMVYSPLATRGEDALGIWSSSANEFAFAASDPRIYSVSYGWMNDVFTVASAQTLKEADIPPLPTDCYCSYNTKLLSAAWLRTELVSEPNNESALNSKKIHRLWRSVNIIEQLRQHEQLQTGRLLHALLVVYLKEYMKVGLFVVAYTLCAFAGPILLSKIVESREQGSHALIVFAYIAALFLSRVLFSVSFNYSTFLTNQIKIAMGGGIKGCIFNKILSLSTESRRDYTAGNIATIYTVDVDRVLGGYANFHNFWVLPFRIVVCLTLLFFQVSYAMFAGFLTIVAAMMVNRFIFRFQKKENDEILECKDRRMKFINEYLASVLIVKLNVWEPKFAEYIQARRTEELTHVWNFLNINAALIFLFWMVPCMVSVVTLSVYVCVLKQTITASKIFTTLALFRMLQDPLRAFPGAISQWFQALSSLERMQKLYVMKEKPRCCEETELSSVKEGHAVEDNASSTHSSSDRNSRITVVIPADISYCWKDGSSKEAVDPRAHQSEDVQSVRETFASQMSSWCVRKKNGDKNEVSRGNYAPLDSASSHGKEPHDDSATNGVTVTELEMGVRQSGQPALAGTLSFVLKTKDESTEVSIEHGEFVVVHGAVGSGKSSLLHASLGEMYVASDCGEDKAVPISLRGSVALVPQQPWIQNLSIRDNILFGNPFDVDRYNTVVTVCGLQQDLTELPQGDGTQIGERGINLSGGQRARVSLARAVYADTEIILLDDVLAALDPAVAKFVFRECLVKFLHGKTRLLVTHNPEFVTDSRVHRRVSLNVFPHESHGGIVGKLSSECAGCLSLQASELVPAGVALSAPLAVPLASVSLSPSLSPPPSSPTPGNKAVFSAVEERAEGRVKPEVYMKYLNSLGGFRFVIFLCCVQTCWQLLSVSSDLFLSHWTQQTPEQQHRHLSQNLGIYSALSLSSGLIVLVRTLTVSWSGYGAAKWVFDQVLGSLLSAPMAWFDRNPSGRILNRLSDDQGKVDMKMPFAYGSIFAILFALLGDLITVLMVTRYLIFLILPMSFVYFKTMKLYLNASREIQRMTSIANSPVLSLMSESCVGVYVIRAFGLDTVRRFVDRHGNLINNHNALQYVGSAARCWFTFRIQCIGSILLLMISLIACTSVFVDLSPGLVGLCLAYGLTITTNLQTIVEDVSELEIAMVCPERLLQYSSLPAEGTLEQKVSCK
jgi:ABC-type multidrug transport system fused ATPase/permease subunit